MESKELYNLTEKFLLENNIYSEVSTFLFEGYHRTLYDFVYENRHIKSIYYLFMDIEWQSSTIAEHNFGRDIKDKFYDEYCI